jgi:putative PIN family toxin of toxin-antitoxin system
MSRNWRVVLDTSTLVSAALYTGSIPDQALTKAMEYFDLCASVETLAELEQVLDRGKFDRYRKPDSRFAFVTMIRQRSHLFAVDLVDLSVIDPPCRDPKDNQFLALSQVAEADLLVSSDEDLLVLHPWRGIPILTPADFLVRFNASSPG